MSAEAGELIKAAREKKGWTQDYMAKKLKISLRQYNKYESGTFPKFKHEPVKLIDQLLGTKIYALIYEQDNPTSVQGKVDYINRVGVPDINSEKMIKLLRANNALLLTALEAQAEILAKLKETSVQVERDNLDNKTATHLRVLKQMDS